MTRDMLFTERVAARHDAGRAFGWLVALRQRGRIDLPLDARDRLVDVLLTSSPHLAEIPDELRIEIVDGRSAAAPPADADAHARRIASAPS